MVLPRMQHLPQGGPLLLRVHAAQPVNLHVLYQQMRHAEFSYLSRKQIGSSMGWFQRLAQA
jgi:hypothetical protein